MRFLALRHRRDHRRVIADCWETVAAVRAAQARVEEGYLHWRRPGSELDAVLVPIDSP